jgi:hypothetical protein
MKLKLLTLLVFSAASFAVTSSAQATPAYRACLHEYAEIYALGGNMFAGGSLGVAILKASSYCAGTMRLSPK